MNVTRMNISSIRTNPDNPRVIKDDKFNRLVASIKQFPEMLELRPIIVNAELVVLGGNMRLKACQAAGLKDVPVVVADQLTADQQREFIIKDNVGFGEWDWDALANTWDTDDLQEWGLSEISVFAAVSAEAERDIDLPTMSASAESYLNNTIRQIVLHYDMETHADVLKRLQTVAQAHDIEDDNSATVLALLEYWERNQR
jgi:hypothetical protein